MRQILLIALAMMVAVPTAFAQTQWNLDGTLATETASGHGIAVDPDGKIWWQPFGATDSVQVNDLDGAFYRTRVIYVYNPDGSLNAMSPIKFIDLPGGARDTLGGRVTLDSNGAKQWEGVSGRGLASDGDGNIIVSQWKTTYRINYQTGAGMGKSIAGREAGFCSGTAAAPASGSGRIFLAAVCPGAPIIELDTDMSTLGNAVDATSGFARSFAVSPDGNKIYWSGYTTHGVYLWERADEFSAFDSMGVVIPGVDSESLAWQPGTGWLWVSAGSPNDLPNRLDGVTTSWAPQSWYAFDPAELAVDTVPPAHAFFTWSQAGAGEGDGRPRGLAFSPDGSLAYVTQFSQGGGEQVQVFSATATAIETLENTVPQGFVLFQAYPNPFNPSANINFSLDRTGHARLAVYDLMGREVGLLVDQEMAPGTYQYAFDAEGLASGTYLYRLEFGGLSATGRMTLLK
jgi:DNA-binding beta-propeller fold protein YncE